MSLWFISRHGEAEPKADRDFDRCLTSLGKANILQLWEQMKSDGEQLPTAILASPYVRAQETAALIAEVVAVPKIQTSELLVPDASVSNLLEELSLHHNPSESLLLVTHMPFVGQLYSQWCHGIGAPAASFATGQVVAIKGEPSLGGAKLLRKYTA